MKIKLTVIAGPYAGQVFEMDGHDTLLVGRAADAHLRLPDGDPYFSRRHFVVEANPPRCRVLDLNSRNGIRWNGVRVPAADVRHGDEIAAGHTVFKVAVVAADGAETPTIDLPAAATASTVDYHAFPAVPGYRIEAELGRGGMGVVYRAVRERDGRAVALKTITPDRGASRRHVDRFLRECRILAALDHPNVVRFHDIGEAGEMVVLAMELVNGEDLEKRLQAHGPAEVRIAVRIVCQVLGGLAQAHAKGFVHRDIKPANVLIGRVGAKSVAKLADFGLARMVETSKLSGLTMQGEVGGTPWFIAPEQVTHYRQAKPAADQYAAAATLYRALTNHYTHDFPKGIAAQLAHVVSVRPVPIRDRRPDVPDGLATIIHRALTQEPDDRYPDVSAFRTELKRFA